MPRKGSKDPVCNPSACDYCPFPYCIQDPGRRYEHFRRMVLKTNRFEYWVSTRGYAWRVDNQGRVSPVATYRSGKSVRASIAPLGNPKLKRLVWMAAKGRWPRKDEEITCIDGDPSNCSMDNLRLRRKGHPRKDKRWRKVAVEEDGGKRIYPSVASAAEALYASPSTLSWYLRGKIRKCCLEKKGRVIRYADKDER